MTKSRFRSFRKFIGTLTCKNWTSALHDVYDEGEGMITNRPVKKSVENTERTTSTETSFNFNSYHGASSADDDLPKQSFFRFFISSNGPPQVVFISFLLALALGSTIGVVPDVTTDRYARLHYDFAGDPCYTYNQYDKPIECIHGSEDAQNSSAISSFFANFATFVTSSLIGSISDTRGRKPVMIAGTLISLIPPLMLIFMQINETFNPFWYFSGNALSGFVGWAPVALSCISDVVPAALRAPSFGLQIAGFSLGFAFSPTFAILFGHFGVSLFSFGLLLTGFLFLVFYFPETLPEEVSNEALKLKEEESARHPTFWTKFVYTVVRPFRELSIINRNELFRLLSALSFLSGVSSSADQSLLLYYADDRLSFNDNDVALLFMLVGISGVIVQIGVIKPLNDLVGEQYVLVIGFVAGVLSNVFYGLAKTKIGIFVGNILGSLLYMTFPTISAIKANNVDELEQGRIQGALSSLSSLAYAVGPLSMRFVYHETKDYPYPGPGTMFLAAGALYLLASLLSLKLPQDQTNSKMKKDHQNVSLMNKNYVVDSETGRGSYGAVDSGT